MKEKFNTIKFIRALSALGERQGKSALKAAALIKRVLASNEIIFSVERFDAFFPLGRAKLLVDGREIPCLPTAFKSGVLSGKDSLASSLIPSRFLIDRPNINFNPLCSRISRSNFYFAPAVAVSRGALPKILAGRKIKATVKVKKIKTRAEHILVGNKINPRSLVFAHYDSIGVGATDNASGVAAVLSAIVNLPELLCDNLFVFDGNEELSYDFPTYWGRGFRVFEKRHFKLFEKAEKIIVVDCVGNGKSVIENNPEISYLAFPIKNADRFKAKILTVSGDIGRLLSIYHSSLDKITELSSISLAQAVKLIINAINR